MIPNNAVWLITGANRGLGRALAEHALAQGFKVALTARSPIDISDLASATDDNALSLRLDVTEPEQILSVVAQTTERFGKIDVLVNNAGYGYLGAIEEGEDDEVQRLFEIDLFAPVRMVKAVLPAMRAARSGHIVNISSIGGLVSYAGIGYYNMVKAGVEAMSDALSKETSPLGIGVTVVAPGAFRTDFRNPSSLRTSKIVIDDYKDTAGAARERTSAGDGMQNGDPGRAAAAIISAIRSEKPPVHLLIGGDALDQYRAKLDEMRATTDEWEVTTRGTEFREQ